MANLINKGVSYNKNNCYHGYCFIKTEIDEHKVTFGFVAMFGSLDDKYNYIKLEDSEDVDGRFIINYALNFLIEKYLRGIGGRFFFDRSENKDVSDKILVYIASGTLNPDTTIDHVKSRVIETSTVLKHLLIMDYIIQLGITRRFGGLEKYYCVYDLTGIVIDEEQGKGKLPRCYFVGNDNVVIFKNKFKGKYNKESGMFSITNRSSNVEELSHSHFQRYSEERHEISYTHKPTILLPGDKNKILVYTCPSFEADNSLYYKDFEYTFDELNSIIRSSDNIEEITKNFRSKDKGCGGGCIAFVYK